MEKLYALEDVRETLEETKNVLANEEYSELSLELMEEGKKVDNLIGALEQAVTAESLISSTAMILRDEKELNKANIMQAKIAIEHGALLLGIDPEELFYSVSLENIDEDLEQERVAAVEEADNIIVKFFKAIWNFIKKIFKAIGDFFKKLWNFITGKGFKLNSEKVKEQVEKSEEVIKMLPNLAKDVAEEAKKENNDIDVKLLEKTMVDVQKEIENGTIEQLILSNKVDFKNLSDEDAALIAVTYAVKQVVKGEITDKDKIVKKLTSEIGLLFSKAKKEEFKKIHVAKLAETMSKEAKELMNTLKQNMIKVESFAKALGVNLKDTTSILEFINKEALTSIRTSVTNVNIFIDKTPKVGDVRSMGMTEVSVNGNKVPIFSLSNFSKYEFLTSIDPVFLQGLDNDTKTALESEIKSKFVKSVLTKKESIPMIKESIFANEADLEKNLGKTKKVVNSIIKKNILTKKAITKDLEPLLKGLEKKTKDFEKAIGDLEKNIADEIAKFKTTKSEAMVGTIADSNAIIKNIKVGVPLVLSLAKELSTDIIYLDKANSLAVKINNVILYGK